MIASLLHKGLISQAFSELRGAAVQYPGEGFADRLEALQTEFGYMSEYMLKGYKDEKRGELYRDLLQRMRALDYDITIRKTLLENSLLKFMRKMLQGSSVTASQTLRGISESQPQDVRYSTIEVVFNSLLTSGWWTRKDADEWTLALVAMDSTFATALVAAIGLSAMTNFCMGKVQCLVNVYKGSVDEKLRQRALAGVVLATSREGVDADEADTIFRDIMEVPSASGDIIAMQIQLLACSNAEADASEINKNIMPDLVKNQPFRLTKNGFVEKDEEQDCLDPDADERMMDAVKSGVDKMVSMQKNGSDIFFSGFSAMKRFPFFVKIYNWFMPFEISHPDISREMGLLGNSSFVKRVMEGGPFCDSDKYSFVLGYGGVFEQMPAEVKKLVESGEVSPIGMETAKAQPTASFVRLQYLQDMYRFFKLNSIAKELYNPFEHVAEYRPCVAACQHFSDVERKTIFACMQRDERLWQECNADAMQPVKTIIDSFEDKEGYSALRCRAEYSVRIKTFEEAKECYLKCLKLKQEDPTLMRGMARMCYATGEYAKAAFYFDALHTLFPTRKSYVLNYAMAMTKDGMAESVVNDVYKLEYENPGDVTVENTLGWVLLYAGKAQQAVNVYGKLLASDEHYADFNIVLNAFYASLATGDGQRAASIMQRHCQTLSDDSRQQFAEHLSAAMEEDKDMMAVYDIGEAEKGIMLSLFADKP